MNRKIIERHTNGNVKYEELVINNINIVYKYFTDGKKDHIKIFRNNILFKKVLWSHQAQCITAITRFDKEKGNTIVFDHRGKKLLYEDHINYVRHGKWFFYNIYGSESYYLYGQKVSKEEYRKHQLVEELAGLIDD